MEAGVISGFYFAYTVNFGRGGRGRSGNSALIEIGRKGDAKLIY